MDKDFGGETLENVQLKEQENSIALIWLLGRRVVQN
jgi:hypothetical protein